MPDGSPVLPWTFTRSFMFLVRRATVPYIRLHDLHDTHASLLGKHGVPLEVVSKRLGHATIGITAERYLHVYRERNAEAAEVFRAARRLGESWEAVRYLLDGRLTSQNDAASLEKRRAIMVAPTGVEPVSPP
jgi:hypothetical protein